MEITVKGHSGCQIDIVNEEGHIFVYKSTKDSRYLKRLAEQGKKQQLACYVDNKHIRVPYIYELKENSNQTSIKMQYVYSKNFIEFFEQAGFEQIDYLIESLKSFVDNEVQNSKIQIVLPSTFQKKFEAIRENVEHNPIFADNDIIADIIKRSQIIFDNLEEVKIPIGNCHGDLTFSNILFTGSNYYLIDFLDNFIETPLQDIVKIRQDTAYRWSQLMYLKPYDDVRLRIICDKIDQEIDKYFSVKYVWYRDNYKTMQLLNILRILPYTEEKKIINYLQSILTTILNEII